VSYVERLVDFRVSYCTYVQQAREAADGDLPLQPGLHEANAANIADHLEEAFQEWLQRKRFRKAHGQGHLGIIHGGG
jgi:hypothetical protein